MTVLAHGIGGIRDLPLPLWFFYYAAAVVLVASFVALGVLWRRPLLEPRADGRELPSRLQRILRGPELRFVLGLVSLGLLVLVFATALLGEDSAGTNLAPTFVYVLFWLGLVAVVVVLGDVWPALNPWRAAAVGLAWAGRRLGLPWAPPARYPERLGVWPAAGLLFLFAALELAYPDSASPRALAVAIALYSWIAWLGIATFGRDAWLRNGEAFTVYFGLLARMAPLAARRARSEAPLVVRPPLAGLAGRAERPGTVAFVAVMLGSVAFDGLSRTRFWQERIFSIEFSLVESPGLADLTVTGFNVLGLAGTVALVALAFLAAVEASRVVAGERSSIAADFVLSLVPIALAYVVAHYFSLAVLQGQAAVRLASDPFGFGWDLFGTGDFQPRADLLWPNAIWYVQVAALLVGHVLGLVLAHERALVVVRSPARALRTQYPMLALMVVYTVSGLWLLSRG